MVAALTIDSERPAGAPRVRGGLAAGDTLVIAVRPLAAGAPAQLRVYRADGGLLLACDTTAPCVRSSDALTARVDLKSDRKAGLLRPLAVHWESRPAPAQLARAMARLSHALQLQPSSEENASR